jgi:SAM-dependent methyltransferase
MEKSSAALDEQTAGAGRPRAAGDCLLPCPACGTQTAHRFLYTKNRCDILQCAACGLGRAQAAAFDPAAYYTQGYFSGGHADGYADYLGAEPVLRREFARTVEFIRRFRPSGRLLEVGCAYGFFLQEAKRYFDVAGIELSADAADHCRRHGLSVDTGVADEATLARRGPFDAIVLLDVIEHLAEPQATLALLARHLNPGGIVVLTTGDFASAAARALKSAWRLMTPPQHLWFFTPPSMQGLARRCGLEVASIDHPWKIVPLSLVAYHLGRMAGVHMKLPAASRVGLPVNLFDAMRVVLRR